MLGIELLHRLKKWKRFLTLYFICFVLGILFCLSFVFIFQLAICIHFFCTFCIVSLMISLGWAEISISIPGFCVKTAGMLLRSPRQALALGYWSPHFKSILSLRNFMSVFAPGVQDIIAVGLYSAFTLMNCIQGHGT